MGKKTSVARAASAIVHAVKRPKGKIEVLGKQNVNGNQHGIAWHQYEFNENGCMQSIDGEPRAFIEWNQWPDFCKHVPEAMEAHSRGTR